MSSSTDLETARFFSPEPPDGEANAVQSHTAALENIVSKISLLFILAAIAGGGYVISVHGDALTKKRNTDPNRLSLGYWLTGKTWRQRQSEGKFGPFDSVLWPQAKRRQGPKIDLPRPEFKLDQPGFRWKTPQGFSP